MSRLTFALAVIGICLALIVFNHDAGTTFGMDNDDFGHAVALVPFLLLVGGGIWASRARLGETTRNLLIWLLIILGLSAGYIYRHDARDVGNRLLAGLLPGHAFVVTTSEGGQEIVLHKLLNGHFEADVHINGHKIRMLVDTGASVVALSRADAERAGLNLHKLDYSMTVITANGRAKAAPASLETISIGPIMRHDISAAIAEDDRLDQSLLGMSFLETLGSMQMQTDELRLRD